jgi:SAM-dependent methyltransferase
VRRVTVPSDRVALIGVGASSLALELVDCGYSSIDAVDLAESAINQLKARLGERSEALGGGRSLDGVRFVVSDARHVQFDGQVDLWHDRATLHFLNDPLDQAIYASRAAEAVRFGGHLIVATFAENGPEQCSGLPVTRHTADSLDKVFAGSFVLQEAFDVLHSTPWGATQAFTYAVFRRNEC